MSRAIPSSLSAALTAVGILAGCAGMANRNPAADYAAIVGAPDRSEADRKTDGRRDPVRLFAFTGVGPGMTVLEMGAGGGYTAELLARAGDGIGVTKGLHRIEESSLTREIEAVGFKRVASGEFLRRPEDRRDVIVFRAPTPVDEFVLKFQKPK
jgi:predicted methyltransferase